MYRSKKVPTKPTGFTLIEMLVVMAITGIMIGLLFPAVQRIRESARRTSCIGQARQLAVAIQNYQGTFRTLPPGDDGTGGSVLIQLSGVLDETWFADQYEKDLPAGVTELEKLADLADEEAPPYLFCPTASDEDKLANVPNTGKFTMHYYPIAGPLGSAQSEHETFTHRYKELDPVPAGGKVSLDGVFAPNRRGNFERRRLTVAGIADGASNTLAFGEISRTPPPDGSYEPARAGWTLGATYDEDGGLETFYGAKSIEMQINKDDTIITSTNTMVFSSNHRNGAVFSFMDGNSRLIKQTISADVLKMLSSVSNNEIHGFEF